MVWHRLSVPSGANPTTDDAPPWRLLDPKCVLNVIAQGSGASADSPTYGGLAAATATARTTRLHEVEFSFQPRGGTFVLEIGCLEIPDGCGVRPVQPIADVVSTHQQFVLFRLCCTDIGSPTVFFVYSWPHFENATVVELPNVAPGIWASQSLGLVRHWSNGAEYVVANLQMQFSPEMGCMEAFLDRWWHSSSSWSCRSGESVTLPSYTWIKNMRKWQTDLVIPSSDDRESLLYFVDLRQGIFRCNNPLQKKGAPKFDFIHLPPVKRAKVQRQETCASVGCCNGSLMSVNLDIRDANTVHVTIMTLNGRSWHKTSQFSLVCSDLWAAMKIQPSPALHLPNIPNVSKNLGLCFPVLSTNKDDILYLTLTMASVDREHSWLLRVNTKSGHLERAAEYPSFWNHLKPPYSINCF